MVGKTRRIPSYCRHKGSGQAVVRIGGKDLYLGIYGSPESHEQYQRVIAEKFPLGEKSFMGEFGSDARISGIKIIEIIAVYWEHAEIYYQKNGEPTSELNSIRLALRPLKRLYGSQHATKFGPLALKTVRNSMVQAKITRTRINQHVGRIRRMFQWAVSNELIPVEIYTALMTLEGLKEGRSEAVESEPVCPVSLELVESTLPLLSIQLQDMVRLQYLLGCRPGEIAKIRPCDVRNRDAEVWEYIPASHKTEHHKRERRIFIGRQAQTILAKWLNRDSSAFCFSPKEAREAFDNERRRQRKTPHTPSSLSRKRKPNARRKPGDSYTTASYGYAIRKACKKAGIENWSPNQLRHTRATEIREVFGLEAAQVVMGHSKADVTQIYAERNFKLARTVTQDMG